MVILLLNGEDANGSRIFPDNDQCFTKTPVLILEPHRRRRHTQLGRRKKPYKLNELGAPPMTSRSRRCAAAVLGLRVVGDDTEFE